MNKRTAYLIGWLEGFSMTVWALLSTNDGAKLVDASAGEEYERNVKELKETLVDREVYDTLPYVVKTVPLAAPKVTFKEETE